MFFFNCVSAPLILNGEIEKVRNFSRVFLFSLQTNLFIVIIRLSGRISPTIQPDCWIPEKQAG